MTDDYAKGRLKIISAKIKLYASSLRCIMRQPPGPLRDLGCKDLRTLIHNYVYEAAFYVSWLGHTEEPRYTQ